jgi:hypothetical protein
MAATGVLSLVGTLVLGVALGGPAIAQAAPTIKFVASPGDSAGWVKGVDYPGDSDGQAIRLSVRSPRIYPSDAGVELDNVGSAPPSSPPSFVFRPSPSLAASSPIMGVGTVSLEIDFTDGIAVTTSAISLNPGGWTTKTWTQLGGTGADWADVRLGNGSCGGIPGPPAIHCCGGGGGTYQQAIGCPVWFDGARVSRVALTANWTGPPELRKTDVYVDDLTYDGTTFTTGGPATTVTVANPWPPVPPKVTLPSLNDVATVNRRTGRGTVAVRCPTSFQPCHFDLTLTTRHHDQTIGYVTGTINAATGRATVRLNTHGRTLLDARGTIRCRLSGLLPGGAAVKTGTVLTVKSTTARGTA